MICRVSVALVLTVLLGAASSYADEGATADKALSGRAALGRH